MGQEALGDFAAVGEGVDGDGLVVEDPAVVGLEPGVTRYVRIDVRNDGTYGQTSYIELRSVKLFSAARP